MIDKSFLEKVEEMARPVLVESNGRKYSTERLIPVLDPAPDALAMNTLTGLANYLKENVDGLDKSDLMLHVADHDKVMLVSKLDGSFVQRKIYAVAVPFVHSFRFGQWYEHEDFLISLLSQFVQNEAVQSMQKFVSAISEGNVRTFADDGISQEVTAKTGIAKVGPAEVPNPVSLAPFRTFSEVAQPESSFVFRLRSGSDKPQGALFEADGSAWKLEAKKRICTWLQAECPDVAIIL
ncbi:hypothetical protein [Oryzomonas rubra]|uniref:Phage-related protein n=1 Tax=Oryzomonas rubra TaxID=2509454 RepID=A0A5A9X821_9BACT|nr:hypothetical protein [Oryzomonas rubra]KAA0888803.1 hypothetical protein ET418_15600 [Oryzomonas rubra]